MKVLIIGNPKRSERYAPKEGIINEVEKVFVPLNTPTEQILSVARDAEVIIADAIAAVPEELVCAMPNLKLIQSEGVAYNRIAVEAATRRHIYVCNCKAMNSHAVAEQTILLMLGLLRDVVYCHQSELDGRQLEIKEQKMVEGITDLADCTVGLAGFGDIGKATAERLRGFGCKVFYFSRHQQPSATERHYNVEFCSSLEELAGKCDIVSLHLAVTPETKHIVNAEFLSHMKQGSYLINTSRGDLVDNAALAAALHSGRLAGAAFDTIMPEPTPADHPILKAAANARVLVSPHIGGVTAGSFAKGYRIMWENVRRIAAHEMPENVVNEF